MPEALALLFIAIVAGGVYLYAWAQARNPQRQNATADRVQLERHEAWLRHRHEQAQRERWDADMVQKIETELRTTRERLAELTAKREPG